MPIEAERIVRILESRGFYDTLYRNGVIEAFFRPQRKGRDAARERIDGTLDRLIFLPAVTATHTYPPRHDGVIRITVMVKRDDDRLIRSVPEEMAFIQRFL